MELSLIPESAPFNAEQRAWLNGFLAGWLGLQGAPTNDAAVSSLPSLAPALPSEPASEAEPEPWHDPALGLNERLSLAEGKPLAPRLMATMAQLDCGTCGYLCRTYAEAIANGSETSLTLCSPGGSETSKALKRLMKENKPATNGSTNGRPPAQEMTHQETQAYSRKNPFSAKILRSDCLTGPGSEKEVRHVEIDLTEGPSYEVGDSLGLFPENCSDLVDELIAVSGMDSQQIVPLSDLGEVSLREALIRSRDLAEIRDDLLQLLADSTSDQREAQRLAALLEDSSEIEGFDILELLKAFPSARPKTQEFVTALAPLRPRLYSISSSPKRHQGQVHLTVRRVSYEFGDRTRKGVASTMIADRVSAGSEVRVFVQKAHGFSLPDDHRADVVMVGPGTGIAPFRAFLHEREASGAQGRNWLFFGDQRRESDFLYQDELLQMRDRGILTRLDTAFSRDQAEKVYVQHRILEHGAELYKWLKGGAFFYVCGDAKRMAADVDFALRSVLKTHGAMDDESAAAYLRELAASGRYARDVY